MTKTSRVLLWLSVAVGALLIIALIAAHVIRLPGEVDTPAGLARNTSHYIDMPDGVRIAVDVWLPAELAPDAKVPAVVEGTRYWRDWGLTAFGRLAVMMGMQLPGVHPGRNASFFNKNGYAMVTVDVRGTGASSGVHRFEYDPQEIADYASILNWVVAQPWSSGEVFAVGISYSGTSADLMTANKHPALKAVAPLYSDFDAHLQLARPGGVMQPAFIDAWSNLVAAMDVNDVCGVISASSGAPVSWGQCLASSILLSGVKPVRGEAYFKREAIAEHNSPNVANLVRELEYRDSAWGSIEGPAWQFQAYGRKADIEQANTPMFVVTGWFDAATTDGALARFASFSHPQSVWIGPFSHGGGQDTDPYKSIDAPSLWQGDEQLERVHAFFEANRSTPITGKVLNYYVNGADTFRETQTWPPTHLEPLVLYFGKDNQLLTEAPTETRFDRYLVDFEVGTDPRSRWMTQLGGGDVAYAGRAEVAERLLHFTSAPFDQDMEVTGTAELELYMTSSADDGALHVYLEDIAPDGTIRYLTEGVLRLIHRNNTQAPFYPAFGPAHSFLEADAAPMPTGRIVRINTTLFATSAVVRSGHRLRLNIAGADATSFSRVPETGEPPAWRIYRGPTNPSSITVLAAPWPSESEDAGAQSAPGR